MLYRCHPAFGVLPFRAEYTLDECLDDIPGWNELTELAQEELVEDYCLRLVKWFTLACKPELYFSGAYELKDKQKVGNLPDSFVDRWNDSYIDLINEVDVHELALVSGTKQIVIYESWDNIVTSLKKDDIPQEFLSSWLEKE